MQLVSGALHDVEDTTREDLEVALAVITAVTQITMADTIAICKDMEDTTQEDVEDTTHKDVEDTTRACILVASVSPDHVPPVQCVIKHCGVQMCT